MVKWPEPEIDLSQSSDAKVKNERSYTSPRPICLRCVDRDNFTFCPYIYQGADKSLARPTSRYILFNGENISFDASLVIYIYK